MLGGLASFSSPTESADVNPRVDGRPYFGFEADMLLNTLMSSPELASLVHRITLWWANSWHMGIRSTYYDPSIENKKRNELLAMLPNIETLDIATYAGSSILSLASLDCNPAPFLRKMRLLNIETRLDDVYRCMSVLPTLTSFGVESTFMSRGLSRRIRNQSAVDRVRTQISALFLGRSHIAWEDVATFLALCPDTKVLMFTLPAEIKFAGATFAAFQPTHCWSEFAKIGFWPKKR